MSFDTPEEALLAARSRIDALESARIAYASEFDPNEDGDPDVANIHRNIRALRAERDALLAAQEHAGYRFRMSEADAWTLCDTKPTGIPPTGKVQRLWADCEGSRS